MWRPLLFFLRSMGLALGGVFPSESVVLFLGKGLDLSLCLVDAGFIGLRLFGPSARRGLSGGRIGSIGLSSVSNGLIDLRLVRQLQLEIDHSGQLADRIEKQGDAGEQEVGGRLECIGEDRAAQSDRDDRYQQAGPHSGRLLLQHLDDREAADKLDDRGDDEENAQNRYESVQYRFWNDEEHQTSGKEEIGVQGDFLDSFPGVGLAFFLPSGGSCSDGGADDIYDGDEHHDRADAQHERPVDEGRPDEEDEAEDQCCDGAGDAVLPAEEILDGFHDFSFHDG